MCEEVEKILTTKEVSKALRISESSAKRWINQGKIKCHKTNGGHRRVYLKDLYHFINSTKHEKADISFLIGKDFSSLETQEDKISLVHKCLVERQDKALDSFVKHELLGGKEIYRIIDKFLYPAFLKVRQDCEHPSPSCSVIHKSFNLLLEVLQKNFLKRNLNEKSQILMADIGYPVDGIQTHLYEFACNDLIKTIQLGTDISEIVVLGAIDKIKPQFVFLSGLDPQNKIKRFTPNVINLIKKILSTGTTVIHTFEDINLGELNDRPIKVSSSSELRIFLKGQEKQNN